MESKYSIVLFRDGGEGAGIERTLARHADIAVGRELYRAHVKDNPGRLVMLCDRARVLARSDRDNPLKESGPRRGRQE
jgi:hypothetical protein